MVIAGLAIPITLVNVDDCEFSEILWELLVLPHELVKCGELADNDWFTCMAVCREGIGAWSFTSGHLFNCLAYFVF